MRSIALSALFFMAGTSALMAESAGNDLINGREAKPGEFPEVVQLAIQPNARCSGTIVGPRVLLTAAHCAKAGSTATFQVNGIDYTATLTASPIYNFSSPDQDHDIGLGLIDSPVTGINFASIDLPLEVGDDITLAGYGCTIVGGRGGNDGKLRVGDSTITELHNFDYVSKRAGGAVACFGDSGGPAFVKIEDPFTEPHLLVGITSKSDIRETSYSARTDMDESLEFFDEFMEQHSVAICGLSTVCEFVAPSPIVAAD